MFSANIEFEKAEDRPLSIFNVIPDIFPPSFQVDMTIEHFLALKECKKHYSVKLTEEDVFRFRNELDQIMQLLPYLSEKKWFDIPAYGNLGESGRPSFVYL